MKYFKKYSDYIIENKQSIIFTDRIEKSLLNITNDKRQSKVRSLLFKEICDKNSNIDKPKDFSSYSTNNKIDFIRKNQRIIDDEYAMNVDSIIDYVVNPNIIEPFKDVNSFSELINKSNKWHEDIAKNYIQNDSKVIRTDETENTDKFIEYPNGWYWINLNTSYSVDEAENMGHCGNDSGKILFSLRDDKSNSHITISYTSDEKAMYQCKGRGNSKPKQIYHKYILDLLLNEKYPINIIVTGSYKPELDFNLKDLSEEERENLINKKPTLEYSDSMFEHYLKNRNYIVIIAMINNGFTYNGYFDFESNKDIIEFFNKKDKKQEVYFLSKVFKNSISELFDYYIKSDDYEALYFLILNGSSVKYHGYGNFNNYEDFYKYMSSKGIKYLDYVDYKSDIKNLIFKNEFKYLEIADCIKNNDYEYFEKYLNYYDYFLFDLVNVDDIYSYNSQKFLFNVCKNVCDIGDETPLGIANKIFCVFKCIRYDEYIEGLYKIDEKVTTSLIERCFNDKKWILNKDYKLPKTISKIMLNYYIDVIKYIDMKYSGDLEDKFFKMVNNGYYSMIILNPLSSAKYLADDINYKGDNIFTSYIKTLNNIYDSLLNNKMQKQNSDEIEQTIILMNILCEYYQDFVIILSKDKINQILKYYMNGYSTGIVDDNFKKYHREIADIATKMLKKIINT